VSASIRADLALIGFGNVAQRFVGLLDEYRDRLPVEHGLECRIVGAATRRKGVLYDERGLDAARLSGTWATSSSTPGAHVIRKLHGSDADLRVVIETTTLDIAAGQPAIDHVRAGFAAGCHVITANKGPVAFAYAALRDEARAAGVQFLFEGAVMDGVPIFNLVRETLPGATVSELRGVVNSTTNHVLTALENGEAFDAAVARWMGCRRQDGSSGQRAARRQPHAAQRRAHRDHAVRWRTGAAGPSSRTTAETRRVGGSDDVGCAGGRRGSRTPRH